MADEKKILVVDDHFEMLEFLRSMLELSNQDFEVLAVPSAEEGLMELRRVHFDLVITDVRLPGMSGFDLVRRTKSIKSDIPVIMITAYSSSQGKREAEELGVFRYFPKPLDTDEMLSAVHQALYGEAIVARQATAVSPTKPTPSAALPERLNKRLELLRNDTGATQLILATVAGEVALKVGNGRVADPGNIIKILAQTIADSFELAQELRSREPFTLQFHAGSQTELYAATVGRDYFLAMFFDVRARRGRIGTVWVFAQRAIKELLELLPTQGQPPALEPVAEPVEAETAVPVPTQPFEPAPAEPEPEMELDSGEWLDIEPEDLADLLTSETELLKDTGDLNAFWDEALAESEANLGSRGLSLEEARRQGLLPTDLDFDESSIPD